jgi:hypothetical protein
MVTHTWGNLFHDLVAAIVAEALEEEEFHKIGEVLKQNPELIVEWVRMKGRLERTYWVCAISVNQHTGICGGNPFHDKDPVLDEEHPTCDCGLAKQWNNTPPLLPDGRGIACEMNKFHLMMSWLAATDQLFEQTCTIDQGFVLFERAWCVSELAVAQAQGVKQTLKVHSTWSLNQHQEELRKMKVENMKATRPEDKEEILAGIPDKAAFDESVQRLIFDDLIPSWKCFDDSEALSRIGRRARWFQMGKELGIQQEMMRVSSFKEAESRDTSKPGPAIISLGSAA